MMEPNKNKKSQQHESHTVVGEMRVLETDIMVLGWASDTRRKPKTILVDILHRAQRIRVSFVPLIVRNLTLCNDGTAPNGGSDRKGRSALFEGYDGMERIVISL